MADTKFVDVSADTATYIAEKTLRITEKITRFYDLGDKAKLPSHSSKTFQFTRYDRLPLPQVGLTDGTTPASRTLAISTVSAVAEQWGDLVSITDVVDLTIKHKAFQKAIELVGKQSAETVEREIFETLLAGTTLYYPGSVTARSSITSTDVPTSDTLRKIVANLRDAGASGLDRPQGVEDPELGDYYVGVVDSFVEQDIASDPDFIDANMYAKTKRLWNGEAGTFLGVRFVRSNMLPTITSRAAATATATDDGGTLTTDSYYRTMVTGLDDTFGYEKLLFQGEDDQVIGAGDDNHLSLVIPAVTGYSKYNIYMSAGSVSANAVGTVMYLQNASATVASGTYRIGFATESGNDFTAKSTGTTNPPETNASTSKVHLSFFLGKEAYTVVDLENIKTHMTPKTPSDSDPLVQRRKVGWTVFFKAIITNNTFFARLESESAFD